MGVRAELISLIPLQVTFVLNRSFPELPLMHPSVELSLLGTHLPCYQGQLARLAASFCGSPTACNRGGESQRKGSTSLVTGTVAGF